MTVLRRSATLIAFLAAAIAALLTLSTFTAQAQTSVTEAGVTDTPRTNTMRVVNGEVLDSVVIGNRVIVVGTFTQVQDPGSATVNQAYIAAYNANTGRFDASFRPDVDNFINAVATDGNDVFVTGQFGEVDGENHRRIAKITQNGSVDSGFVAAIGSTPNTLDVANGKVYVGGPFTTVNNQPREAFAAVSATNGSLDTVTNFDFAESTQRFGGITVRWIEVSPDGNFLFLSHSARLIDGQVRSGIARFDISSNSTTLNNWQTLLYENELDRFTLRMRRLAISPDGSYVVQVTSGGDRPPIGDTAIRFPTSGGADVQAAWVSRHFDSVLGVAISDDAVFVGGHFQFQEAPGSDDPFPGDPDTVFGFGANQGPQILGDQVVQREQLGALDPSNGKSLAWNPGSDSFIGVQSLTWDDDLGLLVGHDGARFGGVNSIGRHAIFPTGSIATTPTPTPTPTPGDGNFSCSASFNGGSATVSFTGDLGDSLQLRRNGSWAATVTGNSATINANTGDTIVARLRGPNYANPFQDINCTTAGGGGGAPTPTPGTGDFSCNASISGGQASVSFTGDLGDSLQLRRNGSWAATVTGNSATINANTGDTIVARLRGPNYANPFQDIDCTTAGGGGGGDTPTGQITTTISSPVDDGVVSNENVTITGQATAPAGLDFVRVTVQRQSTGQYLTANGQLVDEFTALDVAVNGTSDTWSLDVTLPFASRYDISARTFDVNGVRDDTVRSTFLLGALTNSPPELFTNNAILAGEFTNVSGSAADDIGVTSVTVLIQNRETFDYFRPDGTLGAAQRHNATLSNPGGTFTNWSLTVQGLDPAEWEVTVDAIDTTGQRDRGSIFFEIRE